MSRESRNLLGHCLMAPECMCECFVAFASQVLLKFHFACYTIETMLRLAAPVLISAGVLNDETSLMQALKPRR